MKKLYRFENLDDTPPLKIKIIPGHDKENTYGPVVWSKGEIRIREKDDLVSVWIGARLEITVRG